MEVKIMFLSNVEVKGFIRNYLILFIITIGLSIEISFVSINIIKNEVVENNQAIIGSIVAANPSFEKEIINIITQEKSTKNLNLGKDILNKYNYNENISLNNEPIIKSSLPKIIRLNALFIVVIFLVIIFVEIYHVFALHFSLIFRLILYICMLGLIIQYCYSTILYGYLYESFFAMKQKTF